MILVWVWGLAERGLESSINLGRNSALLCSALLCALALCETRIGVSVACHDTYLPA
jgi:hypothetical protein